jgi:hypothetical protein
VRNTENYEIMENNVLCSLQKIVRYERIFVNMIVKLGTIQVRGTQEIKLILFYLSIYIYYANLYSFYSPHQHPHPQLVLRVVTTDLRGHTKRK